MSPREISLPRRIAAERPAGGLPAVVIVGRPNVGKSSVLNCLARKRIAIVDPTAGVTRDRLSCELQHGGRHFELWDTGGIGTTDSLAEDVERQIETALARADLVLFVVDVLEGMTPLDKQIALRLRKIGRPVLLLVNKVESRKHEEAAIEFLSLGFAEVASISALKSLGRTELLDRIAALLPDTEHVPAPPVMKLAIVGRQNVGKSTLINSLAGEPRMIVSEIPGTTRDAVDVRFERDGKAFIAVDTAGLKRRSKDGDSIDFYGLVRSHRAIKRADVVLLVVDVTAEISRVDKQLASQIEKEAKPCIIVVNKWDLAKKKFTTGEYTDYLNENLANLAFAPVSFISAKEGTNLVDTLQLAEALVVQARTQVTTADLNAAVQLAEQTRSPDVKHGKRPRLFYATQIGIAPPRILIFASHPQLITDQYNRFLANFLRKQLPFPEIPIQVVYRARTRRAEPQE